MGQVRGRSRITQLGEEICRVAYDFTEFSLFETGTGPYSEFEGTFEVVGGIPLTAGLPDLVLELADGRRVRLEIKALKRTGSAETYQALARTISPDLRQGHSAINRPAS
jgi:hypothetical protein